MEGSGIANLNSCKCITNVLWYLLPIGIILNDAMVHIDKAGPRYSVLNEECCNRSSTAKAIHGSCVLPQFR